MGLLSSSKSSQETNVYDYTTTTTDSNNRINTDNSIQASGAQRLQAGAFSTFNILDNEAISNALGLVDGVVSDVIKSNQDITTHYLNTTASLNKVAFDAADKQLAAGNSLSQAAVGTVERSATSESQKAFDGVQNIIYVLAAIIALSFIFIKFGK
jgi:hypothetical protein